MREPTENLILGQLKKHHYRSFARIRKEKWMMKFKMQNENSFKGHFIVQDNDEGQKTNLLPKPEQKSQKRIKNRVAAQYSREKHRLYVQDLEEKVKRYQQVIERQGYLCKKCQQVLYDTDDVDQPEMVYLEEREASSTKFKDDPIDMNDEILRVDNFQAHSPFGIFFIICLLGVLSVLTFIQVSTVAPRSLADYKLPQQQKEVHPIMKKSHQIRPKVNREVITNLASYLKRGGTNHYPAHEQKTVPMNILNLQKQIPDIKEQGWNKMGEYLCSTTQISGEVRSNKLPQFILLRTQNDKRPIKSDLYSDHQETFFKFTPKQWQKVKIQSCFVNAA